MKSHFSLLTPLQPAGSSELFVLEVALKKICEILAQFFFWGGEAFFAHMQIWQEEFSFLITPPEWHKLTKARKLHNKC